MNTATNAVIPLIRRLTADDLERVMAIELAAYPFPWTRGIFDDCIRVGYDCWAVQAGEELIGYCIQTHIVENYNILYRGTIVVGQEENKNAAAVSYSPARHAKAGAIVTDAIAEFRP